MISYTLFKIDKSASGISTPFSYSKNFKMKDIKVKNIKKQKEQEAFQTFLGSVISPVRAEAPAVAGEQR